MAAPVAGDHLQPLAGAQLTAVGEAENDRIEIRRRVRDARQP